VAAGLRTAAAAVVSLSGFIPRSVVSARRSIEVSPLEYQDRGDRYEGLKLKPLSASTIELISATTEYADGNQIPDYLRLRFYLDQENTPFITVRELEPKHFYWMDKIRPHEPWRGGAENEFAWPTKDVIVHLNGLRPSDLAIVARLDRPLASAEERVVPVALYHTHVPTSIRSYIFGFRSSGFASVGVAVSSDRALTTKPLIQKRAWPNRPFTISWDGANHPEGWYKLLLDGRFPDNGQTVRQSVSFYHKG